MRVGIFIYCLVALLVGAIATCRYIEVEYSQPSREMSKMKVGRQIVAETMPEYFEQHGRYPSSLSDLPVERFHQYWSDEGSSPRDLEKWSYTTDGSTFSMTWSERTAKLFFGGKAGEYFYLREAMDSAPMGGTTNAGQD